MLANPNVIAHNGVAFQRQFVFHRSDGAAPVATHNVERIGGHAVHAVISTIHHKFHPFGNGAELADYQPVANEVVEVGDMLLELVGTIHIIIVCIVADDDTRVLHYVLDEAETREIGIRECLVGVGSACCIHVAIC